jgi:uncharacterized protein (TIGR02996 family)
MTDDESAFQAAIDAAPLDKLPRLVFCDWLDERGDERAAGIRVLTVYDRWPFTQPPGESSLPFSWWIHTSDMTFARKATVDANFGSDRSGLPAD